MRRRAPAQGDGAEIEIDGREGVRKEEQGGREGSIIGFIEDGASFGIVGLVRLIIII